MEKGMTVGMVLVALGICGFGYDRLTAYLERTGMDRGYTAILVVGGVLFTLLGSIFTIGLSNVLLVLASFAASGLPMVVGSMLRHAQARRATELAVGRLTQEILNDDTQKDDGIGYPAGDHQGAKC